MGRELKFAKKWLLSCLVGCCACSPTAGGGLQVIWSNLLDWSNHCWRVASAPAPLPNSCLLFPQDAEGPNDDMQHVGISAKSVPGGAQQAAEKLGVELAELLLSQGALQILTVARQLNEAREPAGLPLGSS